MKPVDEVNERGGLRTFAIAAAAQAAREGLVWSPIYPPDADAALVAARGVREGVARYPGHCERPGLAPATPTRFDEPLALSETKKQQPDLVPVALLTHEERCAGYPETGCKSRLFGPIAESPDYASEARSRTRPRWTSRISWIGGIAQSARRRRGSSSRVPQRRSRRSRARRCRARARRIGTRTRTRTRTRGRESADSNSTASASSNSNSRYRGTGPWRSRRRRDGTGSTGGFDGGVGESQVGDHVPR